MPDASLSSRLSRVGDCAFLAVLRATGRNNVVAVAWTWVLIVDRRALRRYLEGTISWAQSRGRLDPYIPIFTVLPSSNLDIFTQIYEKRNSGSVNRSQNCALIEENFFFFGRIIYTEINVSFPERVRMLTRFHVARNATLRGNLACRRRDVPTHIRGARWFLRRPHQCCRSARNDPSRHGRDTLSGFAHKAVTAW